MLAPIVAAAAVAGRMRGPGMPLPAGQRRGPLIQAVIMQLIPLLIGPGQ